MSWLLGKTVTFTPNMTDTQSKGDGLAYVDEITGIVDYVNEDHDYFRVSYEIRGSFFHECFKYSQIGENKDVVIHG